MAGRERTPRSERLRQFTAAVVVLPFPLIVVLSTVEDPEWLLLAAAFAGAVLGVGLNARIPRAQSPRVARLLRATGWATIVLVAVPVVAAILEWMAPPARFLDLRGLVIFFYALTAGWMVALGGWLLLTSRAPPPKSPVEAF